jgi:uncharacterized protein with HEPN domain
LSADRLSGYLEEMRTAAGNAISFVADLTEDDYLNDELVQHAVVMCLQRVGEAARTILAKCPEFSIDNPQILLHEMRGIRNRIAHGYSLIDHKRVWATVQEDLTVLLDQLEKAILR